MRYSEHAEIGAIDVGWLASVGTAKEDDSPALEIAGAMPIASITVNAEQRACCGLVLDGGLSVERSTPLAGILLGNVLSIAAANPSRAAASPAISLRAAVCPTNSSMLIAPITILPAAERPTIDVRGLIEGWSACWDADSDASKEKQARQLRLGSTYTQHGQADRLQTPPI